MIGSFLISTGKDDGVYWEYMRPIVVRLVSIAPKFKTKEGWYRDSREHNTDCRGVEFEVELVDMGNEVARFFANDKRLLKDLNLSGLGKCFAIGWKVHNQQGGDKKLFNIAWEVER
jgi:hypothetical protein